MCVFVKLTTRLALSSLQNQVEIELETSFTCYRFDGILKSKTESEPRS
jgi:hypothetical protein